jgi:PTH1 family peptidyl-tRNA hydrolase
MESNPEFLVLGLGNPGPRYEDTRHNLGFRLVDALARSAGIRLGEGVGPYRAGRVTLDGVPGVLAAPATYVNRSGVAARLLCGRLGLPPERLLVACDDLDLPVGKLRFRRRGGDGGHNGLRSIIEELDTKEFPRLRFGIGRPDADGTGEVIGHVLDRFAEEEKEPVEQAIARGVQGVRVFVTEGIDAAMNRFNAL